MDICIVISELILIKKFKLIKKMDIKFIKTQKHYI